MWNKRAQRTQDGRQEREVRRATSEMLRGSPEGEHQAGGAPKGGDRDGGLCSPVLVCAFCNFRNCCKKLPSFANLLEMEELCTFANLTPRQRMKRVRGGVSPMSASCPGVLV